VLVEAGPYLDGVRQYFNHAVAAGMIRSDRAHKLLGMKPDGDLRQLFGLGQNLAPPSAAQQQKF
jgi:hypothetical protein